MKNIINRVFEKKGTRFVFVGVLNTVVGYGAYALFIYLKMHYLLAQLLSSAIGIAHSYLWNKYFTFRSKDKSLYELLRFVSVYAVSYLVNMLFLYLTISRMHIDAYIAGALGTFLTMIISYLAHDRISFLKKSTEIRRQ